MSNIEKLQEQIEALEDKIEAMQEEGERDWDDAEELQRLNKRLEYEQNKSRRTKTKGLLEFD